MRLPDAVRDRSFSEMRMLPHVAVGATLSVDVECCPLCGRRVRVRGAASVLDAHACGASGWTLERADATLVRLCGLMGARRDEVQREARAYWRETRVEAGQRDG